MSGRKGLGKKDFPDALVPLVFRKAAGGRVHKSELTEAGGSVLKQSTKLIAREPST